MNAKINIKYKINIKIILKLKFTLKSIPRLILGKKSNASFKTKINNKV